MLAALSLLSAAAAACAAPLEVALVIGDTLGDKSFYDSSNAGLEKAQRELEVRGRVLECRGDPGAYLPSLRRAARNADLVFVVGFELEEAFEEVVPRFPETDFVRIDMSGDVAHASYVDFKENEGAFLAGALAGLMTRTGTIGAVCGEDVPVIRNFLAGYRQGAGYVDSDIEILVAFVDSWADPAGGRETALSLHSRGADVIFQIAGGSGEGVIRAAREGGFRAIGVDAPQEWLAPDHVLGSMVKRCDVAVYDLIKARLDGSYKAGHTYSLGFREGGVGLSWTPEMKRNVPEDLQERLRGIEQQLIDGEIAVDAYRDKP